MVDFNTIKALSKIDQVKGIKYTATTHHEILRIKDEISPDFSVFSGADEMALSGFVFGADGIIGSFYRANFKITNRLINMHPFMHNDAISSSPDCSIAKQ